MIFWCNVMFYFYYTTYWKVYYRTQKANCICIIESVDSICRDSADTQYMLIQTNFSKSSKQLTPYRSSSSVFVAKNAPVALKIVAKVPNHFSLSSALAHRFFPGLKSREANRTAHWRTMASFTTPFFFMCTHAHKLLSKEI